ncbi:hypothetical protein V6Z96_006724 [Aspergillus fumigatus]|jgi:hypothetical protein
MFESSFPLLHRMRFRWRLLGTDCLYHTREMDGIMSISCPELRVGCPRQFFTLNMRSSDTNRYQPNVLYLLGRFPSETFGMDLLNLDLDRTFYELFAFLNDSEE